MSTIPQFPEFKKLELSDRDEVLALTSNFDPYSDFNFVSMWSWDLVGEISLSQLNNNLIVRFSDYMTNQPFYSFCGEKMVNETTKTILDFTIANNQEGTLKLMPEVSVAGLDKNIFFVTEDRDNFDYVYSIADLQAFSGSKFAQKRKAVNGFVRNFPQAEVKTISLDDTGSVKDILDLFAKWTEVKVEKDGDSNSHDTLAMERLVKGKDVFNLIPVGVYIENRLVAFFVTELINSEYVVAHFMKADLSVDDGLYAFLMKSNAEILLTHGVKLFNYEQDLGIENLRIGKSRFYPELFLKKYTVSYSHS